jgi:hypothetical protein
MSDTMELPDNIRIPLHTLQADVRWLVMRVAADDHIAGIMIDSILERLSQIETASYALTSENAALRAEVAAYKDALTPSAETKADYIGEIEFCERDRLKKISLPWTSMKEFMVMIHKRAIRDIRAAGWKEGQ